MPTITVQNKSVLQRLENMLAHLRELPTNQAEALYDWQTQDMKRKYPNETSYDGDRFHWTTTEVHPKPYGKHKPTGRHRGRPPKGVPRDISGRFLPFRRAKVPGPRPIMRPELLEKAYDRQRELLKDLTWD